MYFFVFELIGNHDCIDIVNELNNKCDQKRYNVSMIPALVIDDKIISQGKILSDREIKKLIVNTVTE